MNPYWVGKERQESTRLSFRNYFLPLTKELDLDIDLLMTQNPTSLPSVPLVGFSFGKEETRNDLGNLDSWILQINYCC